MGSSCAALKPAASSLPALWLRAASIRRSGRTKLPMCSAWKGGFMDSRRSDYRVDPAYSTIDSRRMHPMTVPFRADHIGSLLRPKKLREAFRSFSENKLSQATLRDAQDAAIRDVVRLQQDCGLEVVTDGEFRRISYWEKFVRLTKGLEVKDAVFTFHDAEGHESKFTAPYVSGRVSRAEPITADEYAFLKKTTARTGKITMPSPSTMHFYRFTDWGDAKAYADPTAFFIDLGKVYQREIAELAAAGCKYV